MATNDREAAGREAYEAHLREAGIAEQANAVGWDGLDDVTRQQWIDQADGDLTGASNDPANAKAGKGKR